MAMREKIAELIEHARYWSISEELADILIANDVVPVVRCKDCKYWSAEMGWCDLNSYYDGDEWNMFHEEDFCSYGERKDNG